MKALQRDERVEPGGENRGLEEVTKEESREMANAVMCRMLEREIANAIFFSLVASEQVRRGHHRRGHRAPMQGRTMEIANPGPQ